MASKVYDASSIISLKEDRDKLRKRPTQYIPSTYADGAMHIIGEGADNAIDELEAVGGTDGRMTVSFDDVTYETIIIDNGRGIPQEKLYDVMTVLNTSGKMDNDDNTAYSYSGGTYGVGNKCICYLSKSCEVTSLRDGKYLTYVFKDGILTETKKGKSKEHGTTMKFTIDPKLIRVDQLNPKDLQNWLYEKSYCFPNVHINYIQLHDGKEVKNITYHGNTFADLVKKHKPDTDIIEIKDEKRKVSFLANFGDEEVTTSTIIVDVALAFSELAMDADTDALITTYANSIKTYNHGAALDGAKAGLVKYFREVAYPKMSKKDQEALPLTPSDITAGLCGVISVKLNKPTFSGQHKERLTNQEVKFAVRDAVFEHLSGMKSKNINEMFEFIKRVTKGRVASKKVRKKDMDNAFSKDKPAEYKPIVYNMQTTHPEILLVEGKSAAGLVANARDPHNQAIYPIKKTKNTFDQDSDSIARAVSTFNDVCDIANITPGKKCDPDKCLMDIVGLTDADVDGDGIWIGFMCLMLKHCKPIVDAGRVKRILPPAYSFPLPGKEHKKQFIRSKREFFELIMKRFVKDNTIGVNGKEFGKKELYAFLEQNFDYDTKLETLANRYCCDPLVMEYIAWKYHGSVKDQTQAYWSKAMKRYDQIKVLKESGYLVIDGDIPGGDNINLMLDEHFDKHVKRFKTVQQENTTIDSYTINGKKGMTLYEVMHLFRSYMPEGVERFKGLGELRPKDLKVLCINPETRTVVTFKCGSNFDTTMRKVSIVMSSKQEFADARLKLLSMWAIDNLDLDT